jgi:hypothetical protein
MPRLWTWLAHQPVQVPVRPRACPWSGQQQQRTRWPRRQVFVRLRLCTWDSGTPPEQLPLALLSQHCLGAAVNAGRRPSVSQELGPRPAAAGERRRAGGRGLAAAASSAS